LFLLSSGLFAVESPNDPIADAVDVPRHHAVPDNRWDIIAYGGIYTATDFSKIVTRLETDYKPSYLAAVAINYETPARLRSLRFETEGQIVQHSGWMDHMEYNGVLVARWHSIHPYIPISLAFGEGLSYATEIPSVENREVDLGKLQFFRQESNRWLNYFYLELDVALPVFQELQPRLLFRIHHRSGVFGTYCEYICGSNFITYGMKVGL
jgi:hypothetical protein